MKDHPVFSEALRLLFPLAALHGLLLPALWIAAGQYELPFLVDIPPSQWHAHEMIFGTFAMALAGFLATAVPEWTDTRKVMGGHLVLLASLWVPGRLIGLAAIEFLSPLAGLCDFLFLVLLSITIGRALLDRRNRKNRVFLFWLLPLTAAEVATRIAWHRGDFDLSARLLEAALCLLIVFFSLSASRIVVAVINRALDPTGETTPYRPHPGRLHTAGAMTAAYLVAILVFPGSHISGWLALAAGAAYMDRLAEWFIGRKAFKTEILALAIATAFAGFGFFTIGVAQLLEGPFRVAGLHMLAMGALGTATLAVFAIAGLLHTGRDLIRLPWQAPVSIALMVLATLLRVTPEFDFASSFHGPHYILATALWAAAFLVWLQGFLPIMTTASVDR